MQIPKFLELIGVGYTAWFTYRFLLFKVAFPYFDLHSMQDVVLQACGWGSIFFLRSCFLTLFVLPLPCSLVERSWLRPLRRSKARSRGLQALPSRTTRLKLELVSAARLNAKKNVTLSFNLKSVVAECCNSAQFFYVFSSNEMLSGRGLLFGATPLSSNSLAVQPSRTVCC